MKTVKVRNDRPCDGCGELIPKGEKALFTEGKGPAYDEDDIQVGIRFYKIWFHNYRCDLTKDERAKCNSDQHEWGPEYIFDHYVDGQRVCVPTDCDVCKVCGTIRPAIDE